jgi:hypothetical protein
MRGGFITLPNVSLGIIKEMHVESLRTMGMEGLLQIAGEFHMGQLKKLTVKPFRVKTRTFPSKRNFDRHKIWKT